MIASVLDLDVEQRQNWTPLIPYRLQRLRCVWSKWMAKAEAHIQAQVQQEVDKGHANSFA